MIDEIKIEIFPWLSRALGMGNRIIITEKIGNGESLRSLLERIALKHEGFGAMIYNTKRGTVYDTVVILINNQSIGKEFETKMKDGDKITIIPFYSGG